MRGRKPKPDIIKDLHGSRMPKNPLEPKPEASLEAAAPDHLAPDMIDAWVYAVGEAPPGMLKTIDRSVLEVWVVAQCLHRRALAALLRSSLLVKSPNVGLPMQSPYLAIINRQGLIMLRAASELGFSPASRPRVMLSGAAGGKSMGGAPDAEPQSDSLESYLAAGPGSPTLN